MSARLLARALLCAAALGLASAATCARPSRAVALGARARVALSSSAPGDAYALLGLAAGASAQDVKRAYRRLALRKHPDVNKSPNAASEFESLSAAYRTLIDPDSRAAYDARARRGGAGSGRSWSARTPDGAGRAPRATADPADAAAAAARRAARAAADGPLPEDLSDSFGSLFGDVLKGVGRFVSELDGPPGGADLEEWLSYVEETATRAAAGGAGASWDAEADPVLVRGDAATVAAELEDVSFLAARLDERRLRLQAELVAGESLAVELIARARAAESAERRAASTERALAVRRETASSRAQLEAVLGHLYRVRDRRARLEERLAELRQPRRAPPGAGASAARPRSSADADFARRVDDDLRELKAKMGRGGK